ncbi:hypothetical protein [Leisingera sp. ANG-M1]|uniref:hypothetical protein n=1 Tax=Leisingera sp. ANG-M1 TaxID=1577895 RepID=UPI00187CC24D|nr:hypothetical protein [Leisingera sp. ANG-M1]
MIDQFTRSNFSKDETLGKAVMPLAFAGQQAHSAWNAPSELVYRYVLETEDRK